MMNYAEMKSNYEVIKTFCAQNRYGLTVTAGVLAESNYFADRHEFMRFMDDLTMDEFVGNYLTALLNNAAIEFYRQVNNDELGFLDFVEMTVGKSVRDSVQKEMGL